MSMLCDGIVAHYKSKFCWVLTRASEGDVPVFIGHRLHCWHFAGGAERQRAMLLPVHTFLNQLVLGSSAQLPVVLHSRSPTRLLLIHCKFFNSMNCSRVVPISNNTRSKTLRMHAYTSSWHILLTGRSPTQTELLRRSCCSPTQNCVSVDNEILHAHRDKHHKVHMVSNSLRCNAMPCCEDGTAGHWSEKSEAGHKMHRQGITFSTVFRSEEFIFVYLAWTGSRSSISAPCSTRTIKHSWAHRKIDPSALLMIANRNASHKRFEKLWGLWRCDCVVTIFNRVQLLKIIPPWYVAWSACRNSLGTQRRRCWQIDKAECDAQPWLFRQNSCEYTSQPPMYKIHIARINKAQVTDALP